MPCATCKDEARCDQLGLCQDFARQQLHQHDLATRFEQFRRAHWTHWSKAEDDLVVEVLQVLRRPHGVGGRDV